MKYDKLKHSKIWNFAQDAEIQELNESYVDAKAIGNEVPADLWTPGMSLRELLNLFIKNSPLRAASFNPSSSPSLAILSATLF